MARPISDSVRAAVCFLAGSGFALSPLLFGSAPEEPSRWLLFTGSFHPLVLHLPIGIVIAIAVFEVWSSARRKSEPTLRHFLWLIAAASASVSFVTGYLLGWGGGHDATLLDRHLWLAGGFTALCWFSLGTLLLKDSPGFRFVTWASAALLMTATGHFGGVMVHGSPFANAPWLPDPTAIEILPPLGEEIEVYADLVQPILTAKCQSCHGPGKQNGRLRLDSLERARAGGTHGPALVAGRPRESRLLQSILLPIENEQHMPPKNRPQLNQAEIDLLHWWIETGASEEKKFAATAAPEAIQPFLVPSYRLLPDRELLARQQTEEKAKREEQARRRQELEAALAALPAAYRAWFGFTSETSADLEFAVATSPEAFGDEQLAPLASVLRECYRITLPNTKVTDEGLAALRLSTVVRELNLRRTAVTTRGVQTLAGASNLETLNLYGTTVDGSLVEGLPPLPALRRLFVGETRLGEESLAELRRKYSNTEIVGSLSLPVEIVQSAPPAAAEAATP
jgi:mono/diheme cytochrome c family protein